MKILIGGDVTPKKPEVNELFVRGELRRLFGDVVDLIRDADRTVINLECALTDSDVGIEKFGPCLKGSPLCADALKALGVTDVMLSNNHTFDFGIKGLRDTVESLRRVGLPYSGIGENDTDSRKPYIMEQDGKRIGFIDVCEHEYSYALPDRIGTNPFDPFLTMQDIRALRPTVDYLIVIYHGGKEYCRYPSPRLRNLCREMVLCGADVVLTQHSHCIGCYEEYEGGHILYGQGNFHFCWDGMPDCWYTALLVELDVDRELKLRFYPITVGAESIDLAKGKDAEEIMAGFRERNASLLDGTWRDGWHDFCESMREPYTRVLRGLATPETTERKMHNFAHYLDCEAHTDVWRELYPTWNMTNEL